MRERQVTRGEKRCQGEEMLGEKKIGEAIRL